MLALMKPSTDRTTRLLGWALVAIVSCISPLASCGGGASSKPGDKASTSSSTTTATAAEPEKDRGTLDPRGKSWGGWRWKGKRDNCFYLVDNQCFDDREAACQAAGCEADDCRTDRGAPAKVSCDN